RLTTIAGSKANPPASGREEIKGPWPTRLFSTRERTGRSHGGLEMEPKHNIHVARLVRVKKILVRGWMVFPRRLWIGGPAARNQPRCTTTTPTRAGFGADGQTIFTTSTDNTARLWTRDGQPRSEPLRHDTLVWDAQLNADNTRLVTRLWTSNAWLWE